MSKLDRAFAKPRRSWWRRFLDSDWVETVLLRDRVGILYGDKHYFIRTRRFSIFIEHIFANPSYSFIPHTHHFHYLEVVLAGGYQEITGDRVQFMPALTPSLHQRGYVHQYFLRPKPHPTSFRTVYQDCWALFIVWGGEA